MEKESSVLLPKVGRHTTSCKKIFEKEKGF